MSSSSVLCVDASFLLRALTDPGDAAAQERWEHLDEYALAAPSLLLDEVVNASHRMRRAGMVSASDAQQILNAVSALGVRLYGDGDLHRQALRLATEFDLPATYDSHYLALAQRFGAELWTCDARLHRAVGDAMPWLVLIG